MDEAVFEAKVARLEPYARAHPERYKWRVLAWAALGYLFLALTLLSLLAIVVALAMAVLSLKFLAVKLLIVFVPILVAVARALWVKFSKPEGFELTREQAPKLFEMLDELRTQLHTPKIHRVLVTPELNAGVSQHPRLGIFGWHENYLMIGLLLLKSLTVEQFKAVLAHELGHLSRGHARASNWIYRLRIIWQQLTIRLEAQSGRIARAIHAFFQWYVPNFNAVSFPLARANEYEADAASVRLTSPAAAAQALTGVQMASACLDRHWTAVWRQTRELPSPTVAPISAFMQSTTELPSDQEREDWMATFLGSKTSVADTHPCLKDRLAAIGHAAEFKPPTPGSSAAILLGRERAAVENRFDDQWRERAKEHWTKAHGEATKSIARLAELRTAGAADGTNATELRELATLEERYGEGADHALTMRRAACERYPDDVPLRFDLAHQLLERKDADGVPLMESAIAGDSEALQYGAEMLRDYYWRLGNEQAARQWQAKINEALGIQEKSRKERSQVLTTDSFKPHGLGADAVELLAQKLRELKGVGKAYLVQKAVVHFPETPMYVLGIKKKWLSFSGEKGAASLVRTVVDLPEVPGGTIAISLDINDRRFRRLLKRVPDSRIV